MARWRSLVTTIVLGSTLQRRGAGIAAAPAVVRSTVRLVPRSPALLALVGVELLWGAGLVAVELFSGPRMVELLGDPERGVAVFGLAAAAGWSISAVGSAATGRLTRVAAVAGPRGSASCSVSPRARQ